MFFPANEDDAGPAKAICGRCPVRRQCVAYALPDPNLWGIWGASTDDQRKVQRR